MLKNGNGHWYLVSSTRAVLQFKLVPGITAVLQFKLVLAHVLNNNNNNNNNNIHHYHKRLGACLIPYGSVYIESRMHFCALFTGLNSSTDSSDVMPVISGSCLSG